MYLSINPRYELCGWKGLPFCLHDKATKNDIFLNREQFEFLYRCDGTRDVDLDALPAVVRHLAQSLIVDGALRECEPQQEETIPGYRRHSCRYRSEVQWSITGRCNFKCKHCFQSAPRGIFGQPTLEQCLDIVDQLAECGIGQVSITGGEPLIRDDFWQIVDALLEKNIMVATIYSNGALVNQQLVDNLKSRGMRPSFQISFDGIGWHDWVRGVEGAEQMALDAMRLLVAEGFNVGAAFTPVKGNTDTFRKTMDLLAEIGVTGVKTGHTFPQGEWLNHPENYLSPAEELEFYKACIPQYLADGRPVGLQIEGIFMGKSPAQAAREEEQMANRKTTLIAAGIDETHLDAEHAQARDADLGRKGWSLMLEKSLDDERLMKCDACEVLRRAFYIGPTGKVLPCMSLEGTPAGDAFPSLFEERLVDILGDSHYTRMADARVGDVFRHDPECMECEFRGRCAAGCRAMAVGAHGDDYLARDERTCMILKEHWTEQIEEAIAEYERSAQ